MDNERKAMEAKEAYDIWADQYDTNENKTRDLEGNALKEVLSGIDFKSCLEIGCGTGKNTDWLLSKANKQVAVDLSEEMLKKASTKLHNKNVAFHLADIRKEWDFTSEKFDLIAFSLVLEHLEDPVAALCAAEHWRFGEVVRQQVDVGGHREGRGVMAEPDLHLLGVEAREEKAGRAGVAEDVRAGLHACLLLGRREDAAVDVLVVQVAA